MLTLAIKQCVTILIAPMWMWHTTDMLSGEYGVAADMHNPDHHDYRDTEGATLIGLVPRARLLNRTVARAIGV